MHTRATGECVAGDSGAKAFLTLPVTGSTDVGIAGGVTHVSFELPGQ